MPQVRVHRVNFFRPQPKEIKRIAYDINVCLLAVLRSDFSIELWDMKSKPFLDRVIPNATDDSVDCIAWYKGRLFAFNLFGYIIEYDLNLLCPKYRYHVSAGAIWCASVNEEKGLLAVGTEDGTVCILQITPNGVDFMRNLYKQEARIICLDWSRSGDIIVAGSINCLKIWNLLNGNSETITFGSKVQSKETLVWCIAVTSDLTIISGDSNGKTSFWDGKTGTLISTSAAHKADVLTLCLNKEENVVYSSGVDPIIVMFVKSKTANSGREKWMRSVQRIVHTHDVNAMQLAGEFLASGGVDASLVFSKFPPKTVVKFSPFSQLSYCSVASEASLVLLRYHSELEVWKLGKTEALSGSDGEPLPLTLSPVKAFLLLSKRREQIICSAISSDGRWLAYSTASLLELFQFNMGSGVPYVQKVKSLPKSLRIAAHSLVFKPSQPHLVCSTGEGIIRILECDLISPKLLASSSSVNPGLFGRKHLLAASEDFVACGDHSGNVVIYDSSNLKVYSILPQYKYQPTALQFDKASENLVVAYSDRKVVEYDLKTKAFSEWSRKESVTKEMLQKHSYYPIVGISFVPEGKDILLHDETSIYTIDRSCQNKSKYAKQSDGSSIAMQRKNESFRVTNRYKHLLSFQAMKEDLIAIEVPPNFILNSLPPALRKKKFGV